MSVWKKFQRVGKKAAKYQFVASYTELKLETHNFKPENIVITWIHRSRKYASEPIKLISTQTSPNTFTYVWDNPTNVEITTTLYKMKKEIKYEEKDWTFQLEDVRNDGGRRRILAYRNINISEYADSLPTQHNMKVKFKLSSKKINSATLFLSLSSAFIKEGEATDDDMISVASLMSLPSSNQLYSGMSNDIARLSDLDDMYTSTIEETEDNQDSTPTPSNTVILNSNDVSGQISQLCNQIDQFHTFSPSYDKRDSDKSPLPNINNDNSNKSNNQTQNENTPPLNKESSNEIPTKPSMDQSKSVDESVTLLQTPNSSSSSLMDWCQKITNGYDNIGITNFTTSFRDGMAFCAIIHHFRPELIDYNKLSPNNARENVCLALNVANGLGIPKLLDSNAISMLKVPDPLSVITYLHQLQTHFTDSNIIVTPASIGSNSPGSYTKASTLRSDINTNLTKFPEFNEVSDIPNLPITTPNTNLDKLSNRTTLQTNDIKPDLSPSMSSKIKKVPKSPKSSKVKLSSFNVDGSVKEECFISGNKVKKINIGKLNTFSNSPESQNKQPNTVPHSSNGFGTNNQSKSNSISSEPDTVVNSNSKHTSTTEGPTYLTAEFDALEQEQEKIDEEASKVERRLRIVMNKSSQMTGNNQRRREDEEQESILLAKWFDLVNKKNALIRRNMQLQILEKEQNLEQKWNMLQNELRQILSVDEDYKSSDMKRREDLLMKDLINIINQRDSVVHELDKYEKGIAADLEWARNHPDATTSINLANAKFSDKNCLIM